MLLPLPLGDGYDYRVPPNRVLRPGDFVRVPLGNRVVSGVVWGKGVGDFAPEKLKDILDSHETPPLAGGMRRFIDWVAAYTLQSRGAVLKMAMSVPDALNPPPPVTAYAASPEPGGFKMTAARKRVLEVAAGGPPRTAAELARLAACSPGVVRGLADAGGLHSVSLTPTAPVSNYDPALINEVALSPEQAVAAEDLVTKTADGGFSVTLLDGVPGSGKTEVYFEAVARALRDGGQVLVLLPEIALSAQWLARFRDRFGVAPAEWHSDLGQSQRRATWRAVAGGQARVVVGARSALMLPYADLRLIVVDEEHDTAFKQEDGVIYNARDMAVVRARLGQFPAVLVSATPSLETAVNARDGRYGISHLPARHGGAQLPDVVLVDLKEQTPPRGTWLSPLLTAELEKTFAAGEQAMLFLNRRGYAPLTLCRTCGYRFQCPRCTAWLVEHRFKTGPDGPGRLQCHHCGFSTRLPEHCPSCEAQASFAACGPGVERLAEEAALLFPDVRQVIAASDTIESPKAAADLVRRIEDHDVDLIIGTQIVAKGYHFPLLTLVGIVDADIGLTGGDLRAAERSYQLLYQVAGRSGRGRHPGRVLVQTVMPEHPVMQALQAEDREAFVAAEIKARQAASMPPFGRLVALIVSGRDEAAVDQAARALSRAAPQRDGVLVLGPAPAPFALLRGRHRRRLLLKADKGITVQNILHPWLQAVSLPRSVRVQVDVDPYSFL